MGNSAEFRTALNSAAPGDRILLSPMGKFEGGFFASGLIGVTITSLDPENPAVIRGGTNNLQLSNVNGVTIRDLVFAAAATNGINIDDGGSFETPSTNIHIDSVSIRDLAAGGNHDGIKFSGVRDFRIERSVIESENASGGSAIDMVGSHRGVIRNNLIRYPNANGGSGIRPKGGSKDIFIAANRVEYAGGRAIQAGGSTGPAFFRFLPGESGYEADDITAVGNLVVGGSTAASYVNIDGGVFAYNYIQQPEDWAIRILNENQFSDSITDTKNGVFRDNVVVYDDQLRQVVNVGPGTEPLTFSLAGNAWLNLDGGPSDSSELQLPVPETQGQYGLDIRQDIDSIVEFADGPWRWLVNATETTQTTTLNDAASFQRAIPETADARFDPTADSPADRLVGAWRFEALDSVNLTLAELSDAVLLRRLSGDFDASGLVEQGDLNIVLNNWGAPRGGWANATGFNSDIVDQEELNAVLNNWGGTAAPSFAANPSVVPEPTLFSLLGFGVCGILGRRR
ncbi:MAG: right-handed parallel beta-helix repeat-containing protein [Planctomycetota bacterium]